MNGIISSDEIDYSLLKKELSDHPSMTGQDLAKVVSTKEEYKFSKKGKYKVAVIDFGAKNSILKILKNLEMFDMFSNNFNRPKSLPGHSRRRARNRRHTASFA